MVDPKSPLEVILDNLPAVAVLSVAAGIAGYSFYRAACSMFNKKDDPTTNLHDPKDNPEASDTYISDCPHCKDPYKNRP